VYSIAHYHYHFSAFFVILLLPQYALRSVYPASYTHIGQEFGTAVSMDVAGALFVGAPNQLSSSAVETQNGIVHVLQLHSSPSDSASQPSTAINSLSPLSKPIGTSCASLLQQVRSSSIMRTPLSPRSCHIFSCTSIAQGYSVSGIYLIKPTAHTGAPFPIYCDMRTLGGGWSMCYTSDGIGDVDMFGDYSYAAMNPYGRRCVDSMSNACTCVLKSAFHQSIPFGLPQHRFY
jgi:hypothetical protein